MREVLSVRRPRDSPHCKNKSPDPKSHSVVFTWDQETHLRNLHAELAEHLSEEVPQNERHMHAVSSLQH